MKTAIIIVNYKTPWHLKKCIESVFMHTKDFQLILVQNSPDIESVEVGNFFQERYPDQIKIISSEKNLGFVGGVNLAYNDAMRFERVCLLNSDTIVSPYWLDELNKVLDENENVVQVSPDSNAYYSDNSVWKYFRILPKPLRKFNYLQMKFNPPKSFNKDENYKEAKFYPYKEFYKFCAGFCNVFRSKYFKDLGYFLDPNIIHGYWDDFDLSMTLKQFGDVGFTNKSYVYHFVNISFNKISESKKGMKQMLHLQNGLYVMHKWQDKIRSTLSMMSENEILARNDSYVVEMALKYLGLKETHKELDQYIKTIPARAIGEEFLK